jgi:hypothetical protein
MRRLVIQADEVNPALAVVAAHLLRLYHSRFVTVALSATKCGLSRAHW